jgi:hypothetical protein
MSDREEEKNTAPIFAASKKTLATTLICHTL